MYCKICNKQFIRGTDNLPYPYDICCNNCAIKHITYETVEISKLDQLSQYHEIIKLCEADNEKCRKAIEDNNKQIKDLRMSINELINNN